MPGQGFVGQDPTIKVGGFVEKVTAKFIELSKTKSDRTQSWMKSNAKADGMTPAQQQQAADQGMQDAADNIALAVHAALKELGGVIVSDEVNDPSFWQYMAQLSASITATQTALTSINAVLSAIPLLGFGPAYAAASVAAGVPASIIAIAPPPAATELKAHMKE